MYYIFSSFGDVKTLMNIEFHRIFLIGHIEDTTYFEYQGYIYRLLEAVFLDLEEHYSTKGKK